MRTENGTVSHFEDTNYQTPFPNLKCTIAAHKYIRLKFSMKIESCVSNPFVHGLSPRFIPAQSIFGAPSKKFCVFFL